MNKYIALLVCFVVTGAVGCGSDEAGRLRQRISDSRASAHVLAVQAESLGAALVAAETRSTADAKQEAQLIRQELQDHVRAIRSMRAAAAQAELQLTALKDESWFRWNSIAKEQAQVEANLKAAEILLAKYEPKEAAKPGSAPTKPAQPLEPPLVP